jgi:predicted MFS family arabinose efflux permease
MGGRMLVGFVVHRWGNRRLVTWGLSLALGGAILFFVSGIPPFGLILMGLGFAPVYPCLMHETPRRFTPDAAPVVIGRQVGAAYVGGALFPGLFGWIMAHTTLELLPPLLAVVIVAMLIAIRRLNRRT